MEHKIRAICNKRLDLQSLPRHFSILMLGPEFDQTLYTLLTIYKVFSSTLETEEQVLNKLEKNEKYSKLRIWDNIEICIAGPEIFESFRRKIPKESTFAYYKKKILTKRISDIIEANLTGKEKTNTLVIVLNGNKIGQDLSIYKKIVAEFKAKGIFYPHAVIAGPQNVIDEESFIEEVSIELGISRCCCHFCPLYSGCQWQNSINTDLAALTTLSDILK